MPISGQRPTLTAPIAATTPPGGLDARKRVAETIATVDLEQLPSAPTGTPAGTGAAAATGSAPIFALLIATLALAALFFTTALHAPASWRSVHLVSLIERPG